MKKRKRKIKPVFIVFNVVVVLSMLLTVVSTIVVGDHYEVHTHSFYEAKQAKATLNSCSKDGVINFEGYHFSNDGELILDVTAVGKGSTEVEFLLESDSSEYSHPYKTTFYVTLTNMIIERNIRGTNFTGFRFFVIELLFILLAVEITMIISFIDCNRKANFSYQMVIYGGVSLFNALLLMFIVYKFMNNVVTTSGDVRYLIHDSGTYFLLLMTPIMLVMAISVSISNIWLMRHEGYRPVNGLGIFLSVVWLVGIVLVFFVNINSESIFFKYLIGQINTTIIYVMCYFECMIVSTSVCAYLASRYRPKEIMDYILILGCGIRDDGTLTPLLKGRVDSALNFEKEQYEKSGKHAVFVPSGGQGTDEVISEGEAMERYLLEQGIPQERIWREDKSTNTFQNFKYSYEVIKQHTDKPEEKKYAFATTNYHIFRGYILSVKNGFRALGISAKTKWYFFPNAFLREFAGLIVDKKYKHLIFMVAMVLFFILL
ncbi:MAG: YdcF family protein [Clostridia bacterium]|nr:YdcF family protein [Clostridia bacterium]